MLFGAPSFRTRLSSGLLDKAAPCDQLFKTAATGGIIVIDLLSLLGAAAVATAPTQAALSISLTPAASRDVQCFILYAVAVAGAEAAKE